MSKKNDFAGMDLLSAFGSKKEEANQIPLDKITANPQQPRVFGLDTIGDLLQSIERLGLIEPIVVRREGDRYQIIAGERRYRAVKKLGWQEIPAVVTDADPDMCYEMALAENEKRKNLNPWEVGRAIKFLREEKGKTAEQVSHILGYSIRYVKQLSSIARLAQEVMANFLQTGGEPSVKNLEKLLKQQEGRGETIAPPKKNQDRLSVSIKKLDPQSKKSFLEEWNALKKKYALD
ncbi:MAG: ParB/RepB/Spo0J family partition protein [Spirochaetota bacterium]